VIAVAASTATRLVSIGSGVGLVRAARSTRLDLIEASLRIVTAAATPIPSIRTDGGGLVQRDRADPAARTAVESLAKVLARRI
jgi:hypothetical protein